MLSDPLTEVLRSGARALLAQAVAAEVAGFLESHADKLTDDGRQRLVRHGHLPVREIMTVIGPVAVRAPREKPRCVNPDPLPQGQFHRRLRGGAGSPARQGCWWAIGLDHRTAQG